MPFAELSKVRTYYVVDGQEDLPVLLFANSLGTNSDMWAWQVPLLSRHFRVIRYDKRGHGLSSVPAGEYSYEALADDALELLAFLGVAKAHVCGTSIGGLIAMSMALKRPDMVGKLVVTNTAAYIGPPQAWADRIAAVMSQGLHVMGEGLVRGRWLSPGFQETQPGSTQLLIDMLKRTPDAGYARTCAALRDGDLREHISRITAPTLVVSGRQDRATTTEQALDLVRAIPDARHLEVNAAHFSNWEQPAPFTTAVRDFLVS
jgi:3-oxoadipate enol-lactonase